MSDICYNLILSVNLNICIGLCPIFENNLPYDINVFTLNRQIKIHPRPGAF